ncbi:MAG: hypothetical protein HYU64_11350 [Armatimonadetes bacterium]|nr:hypothetical protein [Armatimonadota bacterium]
MNLALATPIKIIIALVICIAIAVFFYATQYKAKFDRIADAKLQTTDETAKLEEEKGLAATLKQQEDALARKKEQVGKLTLHGPTKEFMVSYLRDLERLCESEKVRFGDSSFHIITLQPGGEAAGGEKKSGGSQSKIIQLSMNGKYKTFVDFLQQLALFRLNKLVTIGKLTLSPISGGPGGSPVLSISLPMSVYSLGGQ